MTCLPKQQLFIFLIIFLQGCFSNNEPQTIGIKSIPYKGSNFEEFVQSIRFASFDTSLIMYRYEQTDNSFWMHNLNTDEKRTWRVPDIVKQLLEQRADLQLTTTDTLATYSWNNQSLTFWDLTNNRNETIDLAPFTSRLDTALVPVSSPMFPFQTKNNILVFTNSYTDLTLNSKSQIQKYFNRKCLTLINLDQTKNNSFLFADYPASYKAGNLYLDPYAKSCINNKQQIICSFSASDTLLIYSQEGNLVAHATTTSKHAKPLKPKELEKMLDSKYTMEYALTNGGYRQLLYDPYRDCYYRVYKHPVTILNHEGKIRTAEEIPWSIIILNNHLTQTREIEFNPAELSPNWIIPTNQGIYISQSHSKNKANQSLTLALIKL